MRLVEAVPPERLLFLHQLSPSAAIADALGELVATTLPRSPAYQRDVFTAWKRHSRLACPGVGRFRLDYARRVIDTYVRHECPVSPELHVQRAMQLLAEFCVHTTLSRSGDAFVKTAVGSRLEPDVAAGLGTTETPYAAAAEVLGPDYNDWVGSLFKTALSERFARTDWKHSAGPVDAAFIFSLLFETLVTEHPHRVFLEHELVYEGNSRLPTMVLINSRPCVCWGRTMWEPPDDVPYPLLHLALLWVQLSAISNQDGTAVLNLCFFRPEAVSSRDAIYKYLEKSVIGRAEESGAVGS